ncbi:hypothetical protein JCM4814A_40500 [Streptomyces phaeofaciens JCM 4814]|uniref:Uncharacterized protein n=1 Tax=Streptomyces phaeofaciens TaxID=68254 RepID=A0A918HBI5_9ACTN|nr:hypothetical protein [Streptomyces phaeofaciens]GGT52546.1 hypothetical protein GCM10010226_31890 [Streptomyces phaeofaciens]
MSKPKKWINQFDSQKGRQRGERGRSIDPELLTYRPDELLNPADLLKRFTAAAQGLLEGITAQDRPQQSEIVAALRQGVLEAFRTREEHLARLVECDLEARGSGSRMSTLKWQVSVRKALLGLGVRVVESPDEREHFVVVEGEGEGFEVVRPAYVDQATGKLILSGQLRRVFRPGAQPDAGNGSPTAATRED